LFIKENNQFKASPEKKPATYLHQSLDMGSFIRWWIYSDDHNILFLKH